MIFTSANEIEDEWMDHEVKWIISTMDMNPHEIVDHCRTNFDSEWRFVYVI